MSASSFCSYFGVSRSVGRSFRLSSGASSSPLQRGASPLDPIRSHETRNVWFYERLSTDFEGVRKRLTFEGSRKQGLATDNTLGWKVFSLCLFEWQKLLRRLDFALQGRKKSGVDINGLRRVVLDPAAQSLVGTIQAPEAGRLGEALPDVSGIEQEGILDRPAGSPVAPVLPAKQPPLQRVHTLDRLRGVGDKGQLHDLLRLDTACGRPAHERLNVLHGVEGIPGAQVGLPPLFPGHQWVSRRHVFAVVPIQVWIHPHVPGHQVPVILGAGERYQTEELDEVNRKLTFHRLDFPEHALLRVIGKPDDVSARGDGADRLPSLEHDTVFGDRVLPLLGGRQVRRIEGLQTDEHSVDPRLARLSDEVRDLVAESVNLDDESQFQSLALPQAYDPVEDRLPVLVTGEVVVRDEELLHPFGVVETNDALDIICGPEPGFSTVDVDDRAEAALERTTAPSVETRPRGHAAASRGFGNDGTDGTRQVREGRQNIVYGRQGPSMGIPDHAFEMFLRLAGKDRDPQLQGLHDLRGHAGQHGEAAAHVEAAYAHGHPRRSKGASKVDSPRKLVGLHADQRNQPFATCRADLPDDPLWLDSAVGFVESRDDDIHLVAEHPTFSAVEGEAV